MINSEQWKNTIPGINKNEGNTNYDLDPEKWLNTLPNNAPPKKNKKSFAKSFSITLVIFLIGLIFVSVIKNKTRGLQKEINDLQASINNLKIDLNFTSLDYEVITSPENLSEMAKKHLEFELHSYKKSQIRDLKNEEQLISKATEIESESLSSIAKSKIKKKYKKNIKKVKELYNEPEKIPAELKMSVTNNIKRKKENMKKIYNNPKEIITKEKLQKWGSMQIVKAILGIPIMPGK